MDKKKNVALGIFLIVAPIVSLPLVLVAYAISTFVFVNLGVGSVTTGSIIHVVLSLLGLISLLGVLIGTPAGILILVLGKKEEKK